MAAVLDEVGKSAEKLVNEEKDELVDEEAEVGAAEASKKKKKKKKKKKAGAFLINKMRIVLDRQIGLALLEFSNYVAKYTRKVAGMNYPPLIKSIRDDLSNLI